MKELIFNYRVNEWENLKTCQPAYGIQKRVRRGNKFVWKHLAHNDDALVYKTREAATANANWLNVPIGVEPDWEKDLAYE